MLEQEIETIVQSIKSGKYKVLDLVNQALEDIQDNDSYQAILSVNKESARLQAIKIDKEDNSKSSKRLLGIPFIAKDNFLTTNNLTTAASKMLGNFTAIYQSTAINRLEAEGAICIAKANLDAFAHGSSTENSDFMVTKNPNDKTRVPGGSSGGSAAVVALKIVPFSIGSDTGGSIRQPASFCGVVGYKPTYGLVSRSGVVAMASSTDTIGVLARNSSDVSLVMDIISGHDELDSTTLPDKYKINSKYIESRDTPYKIAIVKEYLEQGLDPLVKKQIELSIDKLKKAGYEIEEISLPSVALALAVYYILCPAEVSSNLSRYDGIKYGFSALEQSSLDQHYIASRSNGFGDEAKRRIMIGTYVLSSGYYDAYYKKAQIVRTKLINEFQKAFKQYDFLIGPTVPTTAFKIGEHTKDPLSMYLSDIMTVAANLAGVPAVSMPSGKVEGLPIGLQIIADQKQDNKLIAFIKQIEKVIN